MSEPTEAAYEAAARAAIASRHDDDDMAARLAATRAAKAAVDAVWPLAVAEGRRQAAADPCPCQTARDQPHPSLGSGPDCSWCGRAQMAAVHDPRLGLARGAEIKAEIARREMEAGRG
jgi:hypothetical protein